MLVAMDRIPIIIDGHEYIAYGVNADLIRWALDSQLAQGVLGGAGVTIEKDLFRALAADPQERVVWSKKVIKLLWDAHPMLGPYPFLEILSEFEFDRQFHPNYRDHVCHQLKVFLLGLFAYDRVSDLRDGLDEELGVARSAQFPVRWLVTAVYHDIGYVLENEPALVPGSKQWHTTRDALNAALEAPLSHVARFATEFSQVMERTIVYEQKLFVRKILDHPESLTKFEQPDDLFRQLEVEAVRAGLRPRRPNVAPLRAYWNCARSEKLPDRPSCYYDHGIASALLLLQSWGGFDERIKALIAKVDGDAVLRRNRLELERLARDLDEHRESIRAAAAAMALHNINPDKWAPDTRVAYHLEVSPFRICLTGADRKTPLAFLLGLADTLQDWGRGRFRAPRETDKHVLSDQDMSIRADGKRLLLHFPADRRFTLPETEADSQFRKARGALEAYLEKDAIGRLVAWTNDVSPGSPPSAPSAGPAALVGAGPATAAGTGPMAPAGGIGMPLLPSSTAGAGLADAAGGSGTPLPSPAAPVTTSVRRSRGRWIIGGTVALIVAAVVVTALRSPTSRTKEAAEIDGKARDLWEQQGVDEDYDSDGGRANNSPRFVDHLSGINARYASYSARFGRTIFAPDLGRPGWTLDRLAMTQFFEWRGGADYWQLFRVEKTLRRPDWAQRGIDFAIPRITDRRHHDEQDAEPWFYLRPANAAELPRPVLGRTGRQPEFAGTALDARFFEVPEPLMQDSHGELVEIDLDAGSAYHCVRTLIDAATEVGFRPDGGHVADLYFSADGVMDGEPAVAYETFPAARAFSPDPSTFRRAPRCDRLDANAWDRAREAVLQGDKHSTTKSGWHCRVPLEIPTAARDGGSPLFVVYAEAPYPGCRSIEATRAAVYNEFDLPPP